MTQAFIVSPTNGQLLSLEQWRELVSGNADLSITDAEYVAIVPDDGSTPFAFPKSDLGNMDWNAAMKAARDYRFTIPGFEEVVPSLPSRKQGVDIGDANYALSEEPEVHLDDILTEIGGRPVRGAYLWSCSRSRANSAWYFSGHYGFAYNSGLNLSFRALPVVLYPANKVSA